MAIKTSTHLYDVIDKNVGSSASSKAKVKDKGDGNVVVTPMVTTGTAIAKIKVGAETKTIRIPPDSDITVTPYYTTGNLIATITIGNASYDIYAPASAILG